MDLSVTNIYLHTLHSEQLTVKLSRLFVLSPSKGALCSMCRQL